MRQLSILVVADSSARRAELARKASQAAKALITTAPVISEEAVLQAEADIILVDADLPEVATGVTRIMLSLPAGTGAVVLVDHPDARWVAQALRTGVNAILSREITADELNLAIMAADVGLILLHPTSAFGIVTQSLQQPLGLSRMVEALTPREQEVLRLMSAGLGNKGIAGKLKISEHTVKFHISSILGKLNVNSRTEAVSLGIRKGIIPI
ncbi:MAG TPA: response regulator transcription factor [Candidatus Angelobacter sp.]|nr:response regulator transcription factor [Candidatus Angelobacter sp.]